MQKKFDLVDVATFRQPESGLTVATMQVASADIVEPMQQSTTPIHIAALCLGFGLVAAPGVAAPNEYDLRAQVELLMKWLPGEYDNHEQIVRQSGGGLSPLTDQPFRRVHSRYEPVRESSLGPNVISVVDYLNDDPAKPIRTRTYVVSTDKTAGSLRLAQWMPKDARSNELESLGPACDLTLRFVGGQFEGGVSEKSCGPKGRPGEYGLVVGPRYVWFRERPGHEWFEQSRARRVTCVVHEAADGDMRKTRFLKTIRLHDQGGQADIAWPDGRMLTFTIHNRAFSSPPDREYPLFRIHEKGKDVPIAYAYGVDNTARFGLNLGWFYARCYAEGEDMGTDAAYQ